MCMLRMRVGDCLLAAHRVSAWLSYGNLVAVLDVRTLASVRAVAADD